MNDSTASDVGWWNDLDEEIVKCLNDGPMAASELARRLRLSDSAMVSLLLMLAAEGKLRIGPVELIEGP
jgi:hypothetical protein